MDGAISKQEQDQVFTTRDQSHAEHEQPSCYSTS